MAQGWAFSESFGVWSLPVTVVSVDSVRPPARLPARLPPPARARAPPAYLPARPPCPTLLLHPRLRKREGRALATPVSGTASAEGGVAPPELLALATGLARALSRALALALQLGCRALLDIESIEIRY